MKNDPDDISACSPERRHCHVDDRRTREACVLNLARLPQSPSATCPSPQRESLGALGLCSSSEHLGQIEGIVTLALVSHFWPLPEHAKLLEMLQRHEAKRAELGVNPANVTMPFRHAVAGGLGLYIDDFHVTPLASRLQRPPRQNRSRLPTASGASLASPKALARAVMARQPVQWPAAITSRSNPRRAATV